MFPDSKNKGQFTLIIENAEIDSGKNADHHGGRLRGRGRDNLEDPSQYHEGQEPEQLEGSQQRQHADVGAHRPVDKSGQRLARKVGGKKDGQRFDAQAGEVDEQSSQNSFDAQVKEKMSFFSQQK
jgi:hypothetical protein